MGEAMTNKTITLARVRAADSLYLTMWPNDTLHECETGNPKWNACLNAIDAGYTKEVSAALADPVPPAGGEPEVFEPHGWAQTDGPRINAFTREFDIAEEWAMAGYGTVELLNREHVDDEIDRLRGEHQAHVGRLQSDVELLAAERHKLCIENENMQAELAKALELLRNCTDCVRNGEDFDLPVTTMSGIDAFLSNQSAPADKGQVEPVAWRITTPGGVVYSAKYPAWSVFEGATIEPLYAEQPAPVAVVMPERKDIPQWDGRDQYGYEAEEGWNACLDEFARLNPIKQ